MNNKEKIDLENIGENLNRNLSRLMEENRVTLSMLYRNTGIAIPTIKRLQTDPATNPTITTLLPIANFFDLTVTELISCDLPAKRGYIENRTNWFKVPIIQWNETITWSEVKKSNESRTFVSVDTDVGKEPYALIVEEDDWAITPKGSVLIINSELTPEHKDYAIAYKSGNASPTLKQVMHDEEKIYLKSLNPYFQPTLFDENYLFLGVLIQVRKDMKI